MHWLAIAAALTALIGRMAPVSAAPAVPQTLSSNYDEMVKRASELLRDDNSPAALSLLTEAIGREPTKPDAYRYRSQAYAESGDFEAALSDNSAAMRLQPKTLGFYTQRAFLLRMLNRDDEALNEIRKLATRTSDPTSLQLAAIYLAKYKRYAESDDALLKLAGIGGDRGQILVQRGQNYKPDAVAIRLADFERGLTVKPDYAYGYGEWGDLLRQTGDHAKALAILHTRTFAGWKGRGNACGTRSFLPSLGRCRARG